MITLANNLLSVHLLHPEQDREYLGSRYCTGGYIHQIVHGIHGPLFSGPAYPAPDPPPFDGQGTPEAFVKPIGDADKQPTGETVMVIGVGEVLKTSPAVPFTARANPVVKRFCTWEISQGSGRVSMVTRQLHPSGSIVLSRTVSLTGNKVTSGTRLFNDSEVPLPVAWFPHPFFPLNASGKCCRFEFDYRLPENPGYFTAADDRKVICMNPEYDWEKGLFLQTEIITPGTFFEATVVHPQCETVTVKGNYTLSSLPVWANAKTFSPEPYLERQVTPGEMFEWDISYRFGNEVL